MNKLIKIMMATSIVASIPTYAETLTETVTTQYGAVQGLISSDNQIETYKGIPYAEPPVGELRWKAPRPAKSWNGVKQATEFQAGCYQVQNGGVLPWTTEYLHTTSISEDCLYLNVWAPTGDKKIKKPVVVYIHGGGFVEGSGSVPIYDGDYMAENDVVYVTLNYRLGVFGFLAASGLDEEKDSTGNYGIQDQIAALKWVKNNIDSFGGDKDNITIMGQSAGANSVLFLNSSPETIGLFNRSVIESSTPTFYHNTGITKEHVLDSRMTSVTLEGKEAATDAFLKETGITVQDLKEMSPEKVISSIDRRKVPLAPGVDGKVLDKSMYDAFTTTHRQSGPILLGFNQDEMSGFYPDYRTNQKAQFDKYVDRNYPANAEEIKALYPEKSLKTLNRQENLVATHNVSEILAQFTGNNVYSYFFNPDIQWEAQKDYGVFHSAEVPFILGNLDKLGGKVTQEQKETSSIFSKHLLQFAKTGNPSFEGHTWKPSNNEKNWVYNVNSKAQMASDNISAAQTKAITRFAQK